MPIYTARCNGSHHGDNPLLRPTTGIQIATKYLPGPTNREHHRKHIGVKTMYLGINYSLFLLSTMLQRRLSGRLAAHPTKSSKVRDKKLASSQSYTKTSHVDTLQAMASTNNVKTIFYRTSSLRIERNLDRFGLLSPTHNQRSQ